MLKSNMLPVADYEFGSNRWVLETGDGVGLLRLAATVGALATGSPSALLCLFPNFFLSFNLFISHLLSVSGFPLVRVYRLLSPQPREDSSYSALVQLDLLLAVSYVHSRFPRGPPVCAH